MDAGLLTLDLGPHAAQHALGVIAGLDRLVYDHFARGIQAGQQQTAFDLRASDGQRVFQLVQRGLRASSQRQWGKAPALTA